MAGAIASPQILQRSGVGPAELLKSLDIPVVQDLPGVGENLQDHLEMYLRNAKCKKPVSLYPALKWYNQPMIGAEWLFLGKGIGAATSLKPVVLSALQTNLTGPISSIISCLWPLIIMAPMPFMNMASRLMWALCVRRHVAVFV